MHKWLTHKPVFLGEIQPNLYVKDLIDSATGQWDREKLFDFLHIGHVWKFSSYLCQGCLQGMYWFGRKISPKKLQLN